MSNREPFKLSDRIYSIEARNRNSLILLAQDNNKNYPLLMDKVLVETLNHNVNIGK